MADDDDEALLARWRDGDNEAGVVLFERHYDSIARFFAYKIGPDHDDLIQATFLALLEGAARFRGQGSFRAFLFAIARHKLIKYLEANARDRQRFDPSKTSITSTDPSPDTLLAVRKRRKLLVAALRTLPLDTQIMIELHYWEDMKIVDIAAALGMPPSTIKTRMRRARHELEARLETLAESREQLQTTRGGLETWAARLRGEAVE